jgi:hypothetical protein
MLGSVGTSLRYPFISTFISSLFFQVGAELILSANRIGSLFSLAGWERFQAKIFHLSGAFSFQKQAWVLWQQV